MVSKSKYQSCGIPVISNANWFSAIMQYSSFKQVNPIFVRYYTPIEYVLARSNQWKVYFSSQLITDVSTALQHHKTVLLNLLILVRTKQSKRKEKIKVRNGGFKESSLFGSPLSAFYAIRGIKLIDCGLIKWGVGRLEI